MYHSTVEGDYRYGNLFKVSSKGLEKPRIELKTGLPVEWIYQYTTETSHQWCATILS